MQRERGKKEAKKEKKTEFIGCGIAWINQQALIQELPFESACLSVGALIVVAITGSVSVSVNTQ